MSDRTKGALYVAPDGTAYRFVGSRLSFYDDEDGAMLEQWTAFTITGAGSTAGQLPAGSVLVWQPERA